MKLIAGTILALAGCASHTAQIAASANDARAAVGAARGHLDAAMGNLDTIEHAAAEVHALRARGTRGIEDRRAWRRLTLLPIDGQVEHRALRVRGCTNDRRRDA